MWLRCGQGVLGTVLVLYCVRYQCFLLWENCDDAKEREDFWKIVCESGTEVLSNAI